MDYQQFVEKNNILQDEQIYHFNQDEQNDFIDQKPWDSSPNYFKKCKISIASVIKMLIHACLGKNNEVMGLMQGRCDKETFIIYDVIYLNAEASEVNVTLTPEAMGEYKLLEEYIQLQDGTILIQVMDVGQVVLMYKIKESNKWVMVHLLLL
ncbi:unnamed protein product [Paramecium pentaurelia]|uniref:JAB1/MPN/MOV34 metalloenzyme domain-containing protein n=1 Tax=Paramecium pentaurelia TaxID=43138 RepID=A0A8S1XL92_9CILI|nr:unnamed protein product [Paramecium pentaurelia]